MHITVLTHSSVLPQTFLNLRHSLRALGQAQYTLLFIFPEGEGTVFEDFTSPFVEDKSVYRVITSACGIGISSHSGMANIRRLLYAFRIKADIVMEWDTVFLHAAIEQGAPLFDNVTEDPRFHYRGFVQSPYIFPSAISDALVEASDAMTTIEGGYPDRFLYGLFHESEMIDWIRNHNLLKDGRVYTQHTIEPSDYHRIGPFAINGIKSPETLAEAISI